jgi:serine/threonine protein kinase
MELVECQDLKDPVPLDTALDYARQIAAGLEAAHEKGIVHRDLKSAKVEGDAGRHGEAAGFCPGQGLGATIEDAVPQTLFRSGAGGRETVSR